MINEHMTFISYFYTTDWVNLVFLLIFLARTKLRKNPHRLVDLRGSVRCYQNPCSNT